MRTGWRQATVIALAVALACLLLALLLPGGSAAPARPRTAATAAPGPQVTDGLGGSCPAGALDGDSLCPGDGNPVLKDPAGITCKASDMSLGWCPGDMPSWPPDGMPAVLPGDVPRTVTFTVRGDAASVRYGPGEASLAGSSPMTVTLPLGDAPDYELAALAAPGGEVTAGIWVGGQLTDSVTAGDGDGMVVAMVVPSAAYDGDWIAAGG